MKQKKASEVEVDPKKVSAVAVFNNKIPGISAHFDSSLVQMHKCKKRKSKISDVSLDKKHLESNTQEVQKDLTSTIDHKSPVCRNPLYKDRSGKVVETTNGKVESEVKYDRVEKKKKRTSKSSDDSIPLPSKHAKLNQITSSVSNEPLSGPRSDLTTVSETPVPRTAAKFNGVDTKRKSKKKKSKSNLKLLKSLTDSPVQSEKCDIKCGENQEYSIYSERQLFKEKSLVDSAIHSKEVLAWMISPLDVDTFMKSYWEKKPLLIKRHQNCEKYYQWLQISSEKVDYVLRRNHLKYGENVDVTSYENEIRTTISDDLEGRVRPAVLWDYYNNGCSVRILNPQTYLRELWRLNSTLQEYFGTFVGANLYLTPPDSQGFAPHYDDIEAFILQIEGKKHWKVYEPRSVDEQLPVVSSSNFSEANDQLGVPILETDLEPGDLLYFPRGFIHQARAVEGTHSLHVTVSCYQRNTWGELLRYYFNQGLDQCIATNVNFRKGLPVDYLSYMGVIFQENVPNDIKKKRKKFLATVKSLTDQICSSVVDHAADQMGKQFIWDSLPPYLSKIEKSNTVVSDGEAMVNGRVLNRCEMDPDTEVKLARKNCVRLAVEKTSIKLYHSVENPLIYHKDNANYVEIDVNLAPALRYLISSYPSFTKIEDLPMVTDDLELKIQLVSDLWEKGLLMTRMPLEPYSDQEGVIMESCSEEDAESINLSELETEGSDEDFDSFLYDMDMSSNSEEGTESEDECIQANGFVMDSEESESSGEEI